MAYRVKVGHGPECWAPWLGTMPLPLTTFLTAPPPSILLPGFDGCQVQRDA